MSAIDEAFNALFFGAGSWLGILLFLSIIIGLLLKWKYTGALLLPITIFLALEYLAYDMAWESIIMLCTSVFILIYMVKGAKWK